MLIYCYENKCVKGSKFQVHEGRTFITFSMVLASISVWKVGYKNINVAVAGLIKPAVRPSQVNSEYDNSGEDFTGPIDKKDIIIQLNNFFKQPEVKSSAMQQGKLEWDFSLRCWACGIILD